ncbi:pilus assembly protein CpaF [Paramagnetospirillum marisnigri]|uniref:Pilus assembly protein CpaF n=1 Tax=Paramagnetospirillum marisnigri TaxID=1285242 RepID=A0A178MR60_9PROT|nr:AAA family ATPase [Paramagnetospirillum marisnigri]OAN50424.1 pilus assembly protein CpaF [Paramagnetospirillum marisnigri]
MIHRLTIDAFASDPETAAQLRQVQLDRQLGKSRLTLESGGLAAAVEHYAHAATPQVVIVEEDDASKLLERLEHLAEVCVQGTKVVVIGAVNDITLYRTLMEQGVSDYLLRPVTARQIITAMDRLFADPQAAPRGRVIAFWGARGGVGASTLAQNTAWELGRASQDAVVYVDLDLAFGTSVLAFNVEAKQTVADALAHPERLDEVLMERCMVDYDDHLQVLASPGDYRPAAGPTAEAVERLVDLAARAAPAVVLDLPRLWSDWTEQLLAAADEVVVVATPDFASLRDVKSVMDILTPRRNGMAPPRLVLNRLDPARKTQLTAKDFEDTIKLAPFLAIPSDPQAFGEAANNGQMVGEVVKSGKLAALLTQLAVSLGGKAPVARKSARKGLLDWLKR